MPLTLEQLRKDSELLLSFINDNDINSANINSSHLEKYNDLFTSEEIGIIALLEEQKGAFKKKLEDNVATIEKHRDALESWKTELNRLAKIEEINKNEEDKKSINQLEYNINLLTETLPTENTQLKNQINAFNTLQETIGTQYKALQNALSATGIFTGLRNGKGSTEKIALIETCKEIIKFYPGAIQEKEKSAQQEVLQQAMEEIAKKNKEIETIRDDINKSETLLSEKNQLLLSLDKFKNLSNKTFNLVGTDKIPGSIDLINAQDIFFKNNPENKDTKKIVPIFHQYFQEINLLNQYLEALKTNSYFEDYFKTNDLSDTTLINCYDEFEKMQKNLNDSYAKFFNDIKSKHTELVENFKKLKTDNTVDQEKLHAEFKKELATSYQALNDECTKVITTIEEIKNKVEESKTINTTKYLEKKHSSHAKELKKLLLEQGLASQTIVSIATKILPEGTILGGIRRLTGGQNVYTKDNIAIDNKEATDAFDITEHRNAKKESIFRITVLNHSTNHEINFSVISEKAARFGKQIEYCPDASNLNQNIREEGTNKYIINDKTGTLYLDFSNVKGINFELKVFTTMDKDGKDTIKLVTKDGAPLNDKQLQKVKEAFGGGDKKGNNIDPKKEMTVNGHTFSTFIDQAITNYIKPHTNIKMGSINLGATSNTINIIP